LKNKLKTTQKEQKNNAEIKYETLAINETKNKQETKNDYYYYLYMKSGQEMSSLWIGSAHSNDHWTGHGSLS